MPSSFSDVAYNVSSVSSRLDAFVASDFVSTDMYLAHSNDVSDYVRDNFMGESDDYDTWVTEAHQCVAFITDYVRGFSLDLDYVSSASDPETMFARLCTLESDWSSALSSCHGMSSTVHTWQYLIRDMANDPDTYYIDSADVSWLSEYSDGAFEFAGILTAVDNLFRSDAKTALRDLVGHDWDGTEDKYGSSSGGGSSVTPPTVSTDMSGVIDIIEWQTQEQTQRIEDAASRVSGEIQASNSVLIIMAALALGVSLVSALFHRGR